MSFLQSILKGISPLLQSVESAGNVGSVGGGSAPPPAADAAPSWTPGAAGRAAEESVRVAHEPPPVPIVTPPAAEPPPSGQTEAPVLADPPPGIAPPVEPFQALKEKLTAAETERETFRQQLEAAQTQAQAYEAVKPHVDMLQSQPGGAEVLAMLLPVLGAGLNGFDDPRAAQLGMDLIEKIDKYDQRLSSVLINGTLNHYADHLARKALERYGIAEADIPDYQRWRASGGGAAPAFTLGEFPKPDGENMVHAPIIDPVTGQVTYEQLDLSDKNDLRTYNYEKRQFEQRQAAQEREQTEKAAQAARDRAAEETKQQTQIQAQRQLVGTWAQERYQAELSAYNKLSPQFEGEFEWMSGAASAMAHASMWNDQTYQQLLTDGKTAAANGEGRAAAIALELDRRGGQHIADSVSHYSNLVKEVTSLRAALQDGKPRLPADAPVIGQETQIIKTQPTGEQPKVEEKFDASQYPDYAAAAHAYGRQLASRQQLDAAYAKIDGQR
jgi:hypothetical protein